MAGGSREVESEPAVSLWLAADLGPVETFAMEFVRTPQRGSFGGYRSGQAAAGVPAVGAMAVGDEVEVGQTVRFHVRDAGSADEDLRRTLEREAAALGGRRAAGARQSAIAPGRPRGMAGQN